MTVSTSHGEFVKLLTMLGGVLVKVCTHAATLCAFMLVIELLLVPLQDCQKFWATTLPGVMRRHQAAVSQLRHSSGC